MRLVGGIVSLMAGALFYLLFRPKTLLGFVLLDRIGAGPWADRMRSLAYAVSLPDAVVYSLPGGLWSLGYVLAIDAVFVRRPLPTRMAWTSVIPLLGIGSELLQGVGILPGSFDPLDLFCYAFPYVIYLLLICKSSPIRRLS